MKFIYIYVICKLKEFNDNYIKLFYPESRNKSITFKNSSLLSLIFLTFNVCASCDI